MYKAHTRSADDFIVRVLKDRHLKKKQQCLGTLYGPALYIVLVFKFSSFTAATAGRYRVVSVVERLRRTIFAARRRN